MPAKHVTVPGVGREYKVITYDYGGCPRNGD